VTRRAALLAAVVALAVGGCAHRHREPPPFEPAPPLIGEEGLPPSGQPKFEIGMLDWKKSDDGRELFVEGTVRNVGTASSRDLKVWVDGIDAAGTRIARTEVLPAPQTVPPGSAARFVARLPNDGAIRTFKVEAIGR
jgi:hypothetical protein